MYVLNLIKKFKLSKELFMLFYLLTVTYFFCDHFKFLKTSQKVYFSLIILIGLLVIDIIYREHQNKIENFSNNNSSNNINSNLQNALNLLLLQHGTNDEPDNTTNNTTKKQCNKFVDSLNEDISIDKVNLEEDIDKIKVSSLLPPNDNNLTDIYDKTIQQPKLNYKINKRKQYNAIINPPNVKNFFIDQEKGFFDIGNANTHKYINGDVRALQETNNNYTLEFWIKPMYFGNNHIMSFIDNVNRTNENENREPYMAFLMDEYSIYLLNDSKENKIPYKPGEWIQIVLRRGNTDDVGNDLGKLYKNGIYLRNTIQAKLLNKVQDGGWIFFQDPSKIGLYHNQYLSSNPIYKNRSCFSIFRLYNRSLSDAEILQNYNYNAYTYGLTEIPSVPYVKDGLICNLDSTDRNSYPKVGPIWYDISPIVPFENSSLNNPILYIDQKNLNNSNPEIDNVISHLQKQNLDVSKYIKNNNTNNTNNNINNNITNIENEENKIDKNNKKVNIEFSEELSEDTHNILGIPKNNKQNNKKNNKQNIESNNIGQILNNNNKAIGIIDNNKNIQMFEKPINKINGMSIIGKMNKNNNFNNSTKKSNKDWLDNYY